MTDIKSNHFTKFQKTNKKETNTKVEIDFLRLGEPKKTTPNRTYMLSKRFLSSLYFMSTKVWPQPKVDINFGTILIIQLIPFCICLIRKIQLNILVCTVLITFLFNSRFFLSEFLSYLFQLLIMP